MKKRNESNPGILVGKPLVGGTRIGVEFVIQRLARGWTHDQILANFPGLLEDDIVACIEYVKQGLPRREGPRYPLFAPDIEPSEPRRFPDRRFTYRNYRTWPDDERWEIIHGLAVDVTEPPGLAHAEVLGSLLTCIQKSLPDHDDRLHLGPFDILLDSGSKPDEDVENLVQPDLVLVTNSERLTNLFYRGIPDWIAEVIFQNRAAYEIVDKLSLYEEMGVPECWLLHPEEGWLSRSVRQRAGSYIRRFHSRNDVIPISVIPGIEVGLAEVFPPPVPRPTWWKTEIIDGRPIEG